ncbi:hypothetical protein I316_03402 [Kwoniella heveanensis BCC8398]|uniref:Distal membrane-arm assembly complex protein 1-like domain-containing protein n=1 Tax=Kwoniella heveanensis BCC8398 TaxID=1296120 RepID=A0A1B9GV00_9TREE|nr:hypothetical protein I316_03402 [Kwoniella heveanensis BCC8398]
MSDAAISNAKIGREEQHQDCLSCRLTGAATFTGLGVYALNQARVQGAFKTVRPRGQPMVAVKATAILGTDADLAFDSD